MKTRNISLFLIFLFCAFSSPAQILSKSKLPIVIINTGGKTIPDEPKINGTMKILYAGEGMENSIHDSKHYFSGNIGIETRGNSTQDFDKKTYSLELRTSKNEDTSVNLFGMGGEEDWILHAMVIDKSHIRIPMSFYLAQRMGHYASKWKYVELIVNNDYRGLYIFTEKIKRDDDRVDIAKLDKDDLQGDSVTGGYILRIDWLEDVEESDGFRSKYNSQGGIPMTFQWYYPKASKIKAQQAQYIKSWMDEFEDALFSQTYKNSRGKRYSDYIDVNSFVDFLIINELSKNADGYKLSSYVHKDKDSKGGKMVAGPIWDFDQTYGVSTVCSNHDFSGWTYLQNQNDCEDHESMPMWWQTMMKDTLFQNRLKCRWTNFRKTFLHQDSINSWIDGQRGTIASPIARNFTKWNNFIGESIWAEPDPVPQTYNAEIAYLKYWIAKRLTWMDQNIPGNCKYDVLSISRVVQGNTLSIYPNPTRSLIQVKGAITTPTPYIILSPQGQVVKEGLIKFSGTLIDLSSLQSSLYFVRIGDQTFRVMKLE